MALPIPRPAPVTIATFPSRLFTGTLNSSRFTSHPSPVRNKGVKGLTVPRKTLFTGWLKKISEGTKWNVGVLEYWIIGFEPIIPSFQSLVRCSETIERNEAYEAFSAACQ
jgi:hypothetical protein